MDFTGQVALVTGVGNKRGIGYAVAALLAQQGAKLFIGDVNIAGAEEIRDDLKRSGADVAAVKLDVSDSASVQGAVDAAVAAHGRLDILVNNAGISQAKQVLDITREDFERVMTINVTGLFMMTQAAIRVMKGQNYGRVVNVSSVSAKNGGGLFGGCHYCASKAAVLGLSKSIAKQVAAYGITVNCVSPGSIDTDIVITATPEQKRVMLEGTAVKRLGATREVAGGILYLASREASFVTGEDIDINGGSYMD